MRARNILINAGLRVFGETIQISEAEWFRFPNCGRKTVHEIKGLASRFGLALGTVIQNWPLDRLEELSAFAPTDLDGRGDWSGAEVVQSPSSSSEMDFEDADERTKAWLIEELKEFDFSVRAQNVFASLELKTVADLIQRTETDFWRTQNCGRKTLHEVKEFLSARGLGLKTTLRNFDPRTASQLRAAFRRGESSAKQVENRERALVVLWMPRSPLRRSFCSFSPSRLPTATHNLSPNYGAGSGNDHRRSKPSEVNMV